MRSCEKNYRTLKPKVPPRAGLSGFQAVYQVPLFLSGKSHTARSKQVKALLCRFLQHHSQKMHALFVANVENQGKIYKYFKSNFWQQFFGFNIKMLTFNSNI
ncbi:MAG TPA: hypothetical protein DD628_03815 [Clostridiales bacterium]|nr:hypothetical protein [Candidatus Apopatosoma intestinale]